MVYALFLVELKHDVVDSSEPVERSSKTLICHACTDRENILGVAAVILNDPREIVNKQFQQRADVILQENACVLWGWLGVNSASVNLYGFVFTNLVVVICQWLAKFKFGLKLLPLRLHRHHPLHRGESLGQGCVTSRSGRVQGVRHHLRQCEDERFMSEAAYGILEDTRRSPAWRRAGWSLTHCRQLSGGTAAWPRRTDCPSSSRQTSPS